MMTYNHRFPYWRRGLIVLGTAIAIGPTLGAFGLAVFEMIGTLVDGRPPSFDDFGSNFVTALGLAYEVGLPFAFGAGAVIAWFVARDGNIAYRRTAVAAFLAPMFLAPPFLGALFFIAPILGVIAAVCALMVQYVFTQVATRILGMTV